MNDLKLNSENISVLASINGYSSVDDLAKSIGRNRVTVYLALDRPLQYRPTFLKLKKALQLRSVGTKQTSQ